jgi:hypothetical protein
LPRRLQERQWLFHGTAEDTVQLIIQQGFNRAFAGKNAVAYGKRARARPAPVT